jgi:hypothetical protein
MEKLEQHLAARNAVAQPLHKREENAPAIVPHTGEATAGKQLPS